MRVPLVVRAPGIPARTELAVASTLDIAPSLAHVGGVSPTGLDGLDLVPLVIQEPGHLRTNVPLENFAPLGPTFTGTWTPLALATALASGEAESYDLVTDPYELVNQTP